MKVFVPAVAEGGVPRLLVRCGVGVHVEMTLDEARDHARALLGGLAARRAAEVGALARCTTAVLSLDRLTSE